MKFFKLAVLFALCSAPVAFGCAADVDEPTDTASDVNEPTDTASDVNEPTDTASDVNEPTETVSEARSPIQIEGFGCPGNPYQCSEHCRYLGGGRTGGYCGGPWWLGHPTCICVFR